MPGMREALSEAYDELDGEGAELEIEPAAAVAAVEEPPAAEETEQLEGEAAARERDESGRFAPKGKPAAAAPTPAAKPVAQGTAGAQGAAAAAAGATATPAAPPLKAPQSWKPAVRELVAKLPPEFRPIVEESLRREREIGLALQQRADADRTAGAFTDAVRPYETLIRASGQQPHQYVGTLLQTAHNLLYGPAGSKPDLLADLIMQAGVPPDALDRALVARMTGQRQAAPQGHQQQFADPRVDKLLQQLEAAKTERTTSAAAEADQTAEEFAGSHEFFEDVREDMANILDVWAKGGKKQVTQAEMERAYELACNLNESVSTVLGGRKAATSVQTARAATAKAKAASSSIRSQPTAAASAQPAGRRAALEAAYDELDQ